MRIYFLIITVLVITSSLLAQGIDSNDCKRSDLSQSEMNSCAKQKSEQADKNLQEMLQELITKIRDWKDQAEKLQDWQSVKEFELEEKAFLESQRRWIDYRDAECKFIGLFYGGSERPMYVYSKRAELSSERVKGLMQLLNRSE